MDWQKLANKAGDVVAQRGGVKSLQEDAGELREIIEGEGSLSEKAKLAAEAIKEPGAHDERDAHAEPPAPT